MSTTVNYKGNTIATVDNETKKLTTKGTWLEDDIEIVDVSSGGSPSGQTMTGTIVGNGTNTLQISCSFAPDLIRVHGDLSGDVTNRGVESITIIKDSCMFASFDGSESSTNLMSLYSPSIVGYNTQESGLSYATYSNEVLTICTNSNGNTYHFLNGLTYTYELSTLGSSNGTPSATAHTIYFEFTDDTNTTITAYYDDSFISNAIRATTPQTYGSKTVSLAQLDNVTWYELSDIPLNTELVDFTAITTGYKVDDSGNIVAGEAWDCVTDYIAIDPSMTFSCTCRDWVSVGLYDSSKNNIISMVSHNIPDATVGDDNVVFTLSPSNMPSNTAFVVLTGNSYTPEDTLSVIRTA